MYTKNSLKNYKVKTENPLVMFLGFKHAPRRPIYTKNFTNSFKKLTFVNFIFSNSKCISFRIVTEFCNAGNLLVIMLITVVKQVLLEIWLTFLWQILQASVAFYRSSYIYSVNEYIRFLTPESASNLSLIHI